MADKLRFSELCQALLDKGHVKDNRIKDTVEMLCRALDRLSDSEKREMSEETKIFLTLYFRVLDNGSICAPFEADAMCGFFPSDLLRVFGMDETCVKDIIGKGISGFRDCRLLYSERSYADQNDFAQDKPFVLYENSKGFEFLFPAKRFRAKLDIQRKIKELFPGDQSYEPSDDEIDSLNNKISGLQRDAKCGIKLNREQATAVLRAEKGENLFITGGAGTGKTTAVFYLLYKVLEKYCREKPKMDWNLYLVAPSGKAQDRLRESIQEARGKIRDFDEGGEAVVKEVFDKISKAECSTIHSLLSVDPRKGGFRYDANNQFDAESIFVVDEASMIDIGLFASLLNAIRSRSEGSRIFILGDENQLPSVEAGAVLGDLLSLKKDSTVRLVESKRQKEGSDFTKVAKAVICEKGVEGNDIVLTDNDFKSIWLENEKEFCGKFKECEGERKKAEDEKTSYLNPVFAYDLTSSASDKPKTRSEKEQQAREMLESYYEAFYSPLYPAVKKAKRKKGSDGDGYEVVFNLDEFDGESFSDMFGKLLKLQTNSQILAANKEGFCGVKWLNDEMREIAKGGAAGKNRKGDADDAFVPGNPVIITRNMKNIGLFNGDNGIVVRITCGSGEAKKEMNYFLIRKEIEKEHDNSAVKPDSSRFPSIFRVGNFLLYPLSQIPMDSIELAYAITIHKSQGSGYNNVLMFLPEDKDSPLLNRQILYTGITRTSGNTYMVSSIENFKRAQEKRIDRWTEIEL